MARRASTGNEHGTTLVEISIMLLIMTIAVVALANAIRVASGGVVTAKERDRALALARDRLEEVKNMGYQSLMIKFSGYAYPDQRDPTISEEMALPIHQRKDVAPYPATPPGPGDDPWTPEMILQGNIQYWRHVKVKFVREDPDTQQLQQYKPPDSAKGEPGGVFTGSNLAYIEVDVTWMSRRTKGMSQVRVTSLIANTAVANVAIGEIAGTVFDDDADNNNNPAIAYNTPPTTLGADDKPVTLAALIVTARNVNTNDQYSARLNSKGGYLMTGLPDGSYEMTLNGTTGYLDGVYTNYTCMPDMGHPSFSVSITAARKTVNNVNIWTRKLRLFTVAGRFKGVNGSGSTKTVDVSCDDGVSGLSSLTVTQLCDSAEPCEFAIPSVAWPSTGIVRYKVNVRCREDETLSEWQMCVNSASSGSIFHMGDAWTASNPCSGVCGTTFIDCIRPASGTVVSDPISVSSVANQTATIRMKVRQYANGTETDIPSGDLPLVRVSLVNAASGESSTVWVGVGGSATLATSPAGGQQVRVFAYMTTTGYTTDDFYLNFDVAPNQVYDLEVGSIVSPLPIAERRHTFVLKKVSTIAGRVWKIAGVQGYPEAKVNISHPNGWSAVVTADTSGSFFMESVPMEVADYHVLPATGSDLTSDPSTYRPVKVSTNGLTITNDTAANPIQFTLTSINGYIVGKVTMGGQVVTTGAVVIASTLDTGTSQFVTSVPDPALTGQFSYSTVTRTDGTYRIKVATGLVAPFYLYTSFIWNGQTVYYRLGTPITPVPDAETVVNLAP